MSGVVETQQSETVGGKQKDNFPSEPVLSNTEAKAQGITWKPKPAGRLTHEDKALCYFQTLGQLGGALGLLVSGGASMAVQGITKENAQRTGLGLLNSWRSGDKLRRDFKAKTKSSTYANDIREGKIAGATNGTAFLGAENSDEQVATLSGAAAWLTKAFTAKLHQCREQKSEEEEKRNQEIQDNNAFFADRPAKSSICDKLSKAVGIVNKLPERMQTFLLEGTLTVLSFAPPLLMINRAINYVQTGMGQDDGTLIVGGMSFFVGGTLMLYRDGMSCVEAYCDRDFKRELKQKMADDFEHAEKGDALTAQLSIDDDNQVQFALNDKPEVATVDEKPKPDNGLKTIV